MASFFVKLIVYFMPVFANIICGGMFFITSYRFAEAGGPHSQLMAGLSVAAWAGMYSLMSYVFSRIVTPRNAHALITLAGIIFILSATGFLTFTGLYTQFVWIFLTACGHASYCTAMQVFCRSMEDGGNQGAVRAAAYYTFSWSIGLATGPFIFGLYSQRTGFLVNLFMGLFIAVSVQYAHYFIQRKKAASAVPSATAADAPSSPETASPQRPDYAWMGWVLGGVGVTAVCVLRPMWPVRGNELGFSKFHIGLILAIVSYVQGLLALCLCKSKQWMYRPAPAFLMGLAGIIALGSFGICHSLPLLYGSAILFGCYSGCFYFLLVFHSLANPQKAVHNVAVNEIVVGATNVVGSLGGGYIASAADTALPFLLCIILVAAAMILQAAVFARARIRIDS